MSTDETDAPHGARFPRRTSRRRRGFGLGDFDEQIADLTPPGVERVRTGGPEDDAEPSERPELSESSDVSEGDEVAEVAEVADGAVPPSEPGAAGPAARVTTGAHAAADGDLEPADGEPDPDEQGDPLVGRTGARFNSRARRTRRDRQRRAEDDAAAPVQAAPVPRGYGYDTTGTADTTGTTDPGTATDRRRDEPPTVPFVPDDPDESLSTSVPAIPLLAEPSRRTDVRPYVRTNGRTRPRQELALETLVSLPSPRPAMEDPEHLAIGELCDDPRSVAEVAALLSLPLGVARVLIDDMAVEGLLRVHTTAGAGSAGPDLRVLERVLSGLHRL